jgi:hypothetical protein
MGEVFSKIAPDELLISFSGDDMIFIVRTKTRRYTIAVDLKSCDTTIQTPLLEIIHLVFKKIGIPTPVLDRVQYYNTADKTCMLRTDRGLSKVVFKNEYGMNSSGTCLTTATTDMAALLVCVSTIKQWDGDLNTLRNTLIAAMSSMGLKPEFEEHITMQDNYWTPIGSNTFLSMVPFVPTTGEDRVAILKASYTKSLLIKGRNIQDQGRSIDYGVATRSMDPVLDSSPYGRAIKGAFKAHLSVRPIVAAVPQRDIYKIQMDTPPIPEIDEYLYLRRRIPDLTYAEYLSEIDAWSHVETLPIHAPPGAFRIFKTMATCHYGYISGQSSLNQAGRGVT